LVDEVGDAGAVDGVGVGEGVLLGEAFEHRGPGAQRDGDQVEAEFVEEASVERLDDRRTGPTPTSREQAADRAWVMAEAMSSVTNV
jgi:hypothetical protein